MKPNNGHSCRPSGSCPERSASTTACSFGMAPATVAGQARGEAVEHEFGELVASGVRPGTVGSRARSRAVTEPPSGSVYQARVQRFEHHIAGGGDVDRSSASAASSIIATAPAGCPRSIAQGGAEPEHVGRLPRVLDHRLRRVSSVSAWAHDPAICAARAAASSRRTRSRGAGVRSAARWRYAALRGEAATAASPFGRALELGGDGFVGPEHGFGGMPRAPVGVAFGIEYVGQCPMDVSTIGERGAVIDRRAHQRMAELDHRCRHDESRPLRPEQGRQRECPATPRLATPSPDHRRRQRRRRAGASACRAATHVPAAGTEPRRAR